MRGRFEIIPNEVVQTIETLQATIERQAAELAAARTTAEYWKANHLEGNAVIERQAALLKQCREGLQTFIDEHEECSDADDWMASMCSLEAVHEAQNVLAAIEEYEREQ